MDFVNGSEEIVEWEDVSELLLRDVTHNMEEGQMIHNEFSLYESMSALELMDPKMDSGMNAGNIMTYDKAVELDLLPDDILTTQELISIIDELTACEATFHSGHSIAHSVFTCLYLHRPDSIKNIVLKTYTMGFLKTCEAVRGIITQADIFEEEDFFNSTLGFKLAEDVKPEDMLHQLQSVEHDLESKLRKSVEEKKDEGGKESELWEALLCRFRYRKSIYHVHTYLGKSEAKGLKPALAHIKRSLEQLQLVRKTLHLGQPQLPPPGFHKSVTRTLMVNAPPRDIKILSRAEALDSLESLLIHLGKYERFLELTNYDDLLLFFRNLSSLRPNIVARSHLFLLLHSNENFLGLGNFSNLIVKSISTLCASAEFYFHTEEVKSFVSMLVKPSILLFRLYCENRARQRRKIGRLLPDWTTCQLEANGLDQFLAVRAEKTGVDFKVAGAPYRHPFFSWVFDQTVHLLIHYMFLGFELELFNPKELAIAYWYLKYLCDLRLQNKNYAWRPKLKNKLKPNKKSKPSLGNPPPPSAEFLLVEAYMMLCHGLCQTIIGLKRVGVHVPEIHPKHLSHWFINRFEDFRRVPQPSPVSLKSWKLQLAYFGKEHPSKLLQTAGDSFNQAKNLLTKACSHNSPPPEHEVKSLRQLIKVCISNAVFLLGLSKTLDIKQPGLGPFKQIDDYQIKYSFETHPIFPVISVEKVTINKDEQREEKYETKAGPVNGNKHFDESQHSSEPTAQTQDSLAKRSHSETMSGVSNGVAGGTDVGKKESKAKKGSGKKKTTVVKDGVEAAK